MSLTSFIRLLILFVLDCSLFAFGTAQIAPVWSAQPFSPPAFPLAVRSPYLNAWLPQGNNPASITNSIWPTLWTTTSPLTWYGAVQVDNTTYQVLGSADLSVTGTQVAKLQSTEFTATRTSFLLQAGPANVNMTFLSPIEPTDLVRQSIPFAYMYIDVSSNDGSPHDVKVYSDISAEWVSGDDSLVVNWESNTTGEAIVLKTQLENPTPFAEILNHAQDAIAYYSMTKRSGISWQIGQDIILRSGFNATGLLNNTEDTNFRAVNEDWPVFGISVDLDNIMNTSSPVVWSIGVVRDPCIEALTSTGQTEVRSSYFWSNYSTDIEVVESFLDDFDRALNAAVDFDTQLHNNASQVSTEYADLVALAARQTLGSLDITLSKDNNGTWNTSDIQVFMKNFDPLGGSGGINAVDVLFSAFPLFVTLNPDLGKYLLLPLLDYQSSPLYLNAFAAHDLGSSYPNATAQDTNPSNLGIEESANMLIMGLAYTQASGDNSLITTYYDLFRIWADYLVDNSLLPLNQFTSDELPASNQTNLAIKGIIGIRAMSVMGQYTGNSENATHYHNVSDTYLSQWQSLAISSDNSHILADYNDESSSALIYNLYADKLLQLGFIPDSIYEMQTVFYGQQQIDANGTMYGLSFDSSVAQTRIDWMMLTAATVAPGLTRDTFVSLIRDYAASNQNYTPFSLEYDASDGLVSSTSGGINSPAQGAMFSLLALNVPVQNLSSGTISSGSGGSSNASSDETTNIGAIVGGVLGGVATIGLLTALILFLRRRGRRQGTIQVVPQKLTSSSMNTIHSQALTYEPYSGASIQITGHHTARSPDSDGITEDYPFGSQVATGTPSHAPSSTFGPRSESPTSDVPFRDGEQSPGLRSQIRFAKQTLVNQQLRTEVDNMRRDMERLMEERATVEAPPSYS